MESQTSPFSKEEISALEARSTVNVYPFARTLILTICVILFIAIALLLLYQNGKSIYDHGI
jgi:hypothetical protein